MRVRDKAGAYKADQAVAPPAIWEEVERRLRAAYGSPSHHNPEDPLDDLVFVVLSRMTQEWKYLPTYRALKGQFPAWDRLLEASEEQVREVLSYAGLARTKARHIRTILEEIQQREGRLSLDHLKELDDRDAERYLTSLPGVGVKTARCVMLYALGRDVCPVDTHVWRVAQRLGLAPAGAWTSARASRLEDELPEGCRASLHVTLVAHGREVCTAHSPSCEGCVLSDICPSAPWPQGG